MARRRVTSPPVFPWPPDLRWLKRREVWGGFLGLFSLTTLLALLSLLRGVVGTRLAALARSLFGLGAIPIVLSLLTMAIWLTFRERWGRSVPLRPAQVLGLEVLATACLGLLHVAQEAVTGYQLALRGGGGGLIGWTAVYLLSQLGGRLFAGLLLTIAAIAGAAMAFEITLPVLRRAIGTVPRPPQRQPIEPAATPEPGTRPTEPPAIRIYAAKPPHSGETGSVRPRPAPQVPARPVRRAPRSAKLPSLDLLAPATAQALDEAEVRLQTQIIEQTLAHFGVPARIVEVQRGPMVTQYGLEPGFLERRGVNGTSALRKVRVSRITALSNDLALALAAPSIRIEAPVPGKPLVGIEVPNRKGSLVNLRSVIEAPAFQRLRSPLRIALGQDVSGQAVAADLAAMPHLLIAGATGSGKSVCINAIIACLLLENTPEALQIVLIDPKRVELSTFNGVPHLVAPVVVDVAQTVAVLRWLCQEMDRRYQIFAEMHVRNITGYNATLGRRRRDQLAYLVVFVDELADLMMIAPDDVERAICRLAQMGRATGIHLVVATQRPSVDVVTGLIKANFPARIAFAVSSQTDSRVILDSAGAEQLLGRGDMLFMSPEANRLVRLQGCFVSDKELAAIVSHWRQEVGDEESGQAPAPWEELDGTMDAEDHLLEQARDLVLRQGSASASLLQRRLRIGYGKAAHLIEQLEKEGIIGPDPGGGRPRPVMVPPEGEEGQ